MKVSETFVDLTFEQEKNVHKYLANIIGKELAGISTSCYMPKFVKYKQDLEHRSNINRTKIKEFKKQFEATYSKFVVFNDETTMILIMLTLYFARKNRMETSKFAYLLLSIKFYSSLLHISFPKFCSDRLWLLALSSISPKHLFREKNGIANALIYLVNEVYKKNFIKIQSSDITDFEIVRLVFEIRGRLSQSIKSFAEVYYALQKNSNKEVFGKDKIDADQGLNILAEKVSMSICTYEQIDSKSLELAISKSGIRREIAESLIEELSNVDYMEQIKFIIILMGKISQIKYICKESGRLALIRRIDNGSPVGKYIVREEMLNMFYSTEMGFRLKGMNKSQLIIFFSHYLTKYIQNRIC